MAPKLIERLQALLLMPRDLQASQAETAESLRGLKAEVDSLRLAFMETRQESLRELASLRLALRGFATPQRAAWDRGGEPPVQSHEQRTLLSKVCRQSDFDTLWFREWIERLCTKMRYHRGLWEWVYVAEVLRDRGKLSAGARGVGFGIGAEPLPALFASFGCKITATDLTLSEALDKGWAGGVQYAGRLDGLRSPNICPNERFDQLVEFRNVNMNNIPDDLCDFDFCWSCCALEHLGSLEAGWRFVERSLDTLRPAGVAVHTTEFNTSSDDSTIESGATVLYRSRDLKQLVARLEQNGHQVAPLDLTPGDQVLDRFIDLPPYERSEPHLTLAMMGHSTTSVALIIQKGSSR